MFRITPAYAGKSSAMPPLIIWAGDHPRVCGEKTITRERINQLLGSPPHMRGKADLWGKSTEEVGITPAYAGKSGYVRCRRLTEKDHPRVCGEKQLHSAKYHRPMGSPPRMRGKVGISFFQRVNPRITPAYAEKSR